MGYIDIKSVVWQRIHIEDEELPDLIESIKDLDEEEAYQEILMNSEGCEYITESEVPLTVKNNDGCPTIEAVNEEGETLYQNGN